MKQRIPKELSELKYTSRRRSIFSQLAKLLTHRVFFVGLFIVLQLAVLVLMVAYFSSYFIQFYIFCVVISWISVLWIVNRNSHPDYKIAWIVPIMAFPLFGGLFYLLFGGNQLSQWNQRRMERLGKMTREALKREGQEAENIIASNSAAGNQSRYLFRTSGCPPHVRTDAVYFPTGEAVWKSMLEEISKAEHFVFLEVFIIEEGVMWNTMLDILEEKAKQGVDVRLLYDDIGSLFTVPKNYAKQMQQRGISCAVFNPFRPVVSIRLNNRDHRKICVVDGHTGYTGGINLADEYINVKERFGYWKDNGILLRGEAVWNLTVMFLANWDYTTGMHESFEAYRPAVWPGEPYTGPGVIQPYSDSPLTQEAVGCNVYLNLINRATRYIYITTPYLVIDHTLTVALQTAAKSGVDVRIITPHIPDKKKVFEVTRAHYPALLEAGVKIYEFTPGFIHAKTFVVDDLYGVVGTINLDYRSLYLHFECGVWIYDHPVVHDIRDDFLETMSQSQEVCLESATRLGWLKRFYRALLRLFAPLL